MMIGWTDFVAGTAEIITKLAFHIRFDFHLAVAGAGEENRRSDSLCALDSLRMIMGYLAVSCARCSASCILSASHAAGETRMALPLP